MARGQELFYFQWPRDYEVASAMQWMRNNADGLASYELIIAMMYLKLIPQ
jgi:hypothetical protein